MSTRNWQLTDCASNVEMTKQNGEHHTGPISEEELLTMMDIFAVDRQTMPPRNKDQEREHLFPKLKRIAKLKTCFNTESSPCNCYPTPLLGSLETLILGSKRCLRKP